MRPSGEACTPAAQTIVPAAIVSSPTATPLASTVGDDARSRTSTPSVCSARRADVAQRSAVGREDGRPAFEQDDPGGVRRDAIELVAQRLAGDLGNRAGHLDPGRPAADHHEGEQIALAAGIGLGLGALEGQQHPAADRHRVVERLQPGRERPTSRRGRSRRGSRRWPRRARRTAAARPLARITRRAAVSMAVTVPSTTRRLRWRRRIQRIGAAMSAGDRPAVAT